MDALLRDLRHALRTLRRTPGFSAIAVLTLALGIGANTAIFSVVDSVLLRPLPYPEPERLVALWQDHRAQGGPEVELFDPPDFADLREQSETLAGVAATMGWTPTLVGVGAPERLDGLRVSQAYFDVFGIEAARGRLFLPGDEAPEGDAVVVLSHGLWQRRFGGEPGIVGGTVVLDGEPYTVAGIVPADFRPPGGRVDVWRPMLPSPGRAASMFHMLRVIGRIEPGVSLAEARAELSTIASRLAARYPETNAGIAFRMMPLREQLAGPVRPALLVLLGAVGFVLLMACANVANLLLARAAVRGREVAIRTALGAGRLRLVRQFLTEGLSLAMMGGALGVLIAAWVADVLIAIAPLGAPRLDTAAIDGRVLGFAFALVGLTGILCGLVPALHATKPELGMMLKGGGIGSRARVGGHGTRSALVVAEIAVALVLLTGAGLLMRSFVRLLRVDPGFHAENILTAELALPGNGAYPTGSEVAGFYDEVLRRLAERPGIRSAGVVSFLPLGGADNDVSFRIEGRAPAGGEDTPLAWYRTVSADYFRTMAIPIVAGRAFTDQDHVDAPPVAVVNRALARRYWPDGDPVGERISPEWADGAWLTIVGVVGDVRHDGLDRRPLPELYLPFTQQRFARSMTLVVRTASDPIAAAPVVREAVWSLDPDLPVESISSMERLIGESVALPRLYLSLFAAFAAIVLLLATIGIYGVTSYAVSQRTKEIGLRMALGAGGDSVRRLVLRHVMVLALSGVGLGLAAALALARTLGGLLHDLSPTDPATFAGAAVLLGAVALMAGYLPARRATRVDPIVALRYE